MGGNQVSDGLGFGLGFLFVLFVVVWVFCLGVLFCFFPLIFAVTSYLILPL